MITPKFKTAADVFAGWRENILKGEPPILYPIGTGELATVPLGPGLVTLIGGAPGSGKTAFVMQAAVDAMRLTESLRVCICNIEMRPDVLLDRQLARLSGINLNAIRLRQLDERHAERLDVAMNSFEAIADRLCFVSSPFDLENAGAVVDEFKADVLVLDYIQRIRPPGNHHDKRGSVDVCMNFLRQFADTGIAVVAVAAVSRTKDSKGRQSYDGSGLNLASFRESSELEFGADDAFMLVSKPKSTDVMILRHLKARHSEPRDIELKFDRARQSFRSQADPCRRGGSQGRDLDVDLASAWNSISAADDQEFEEREDQQ